MTERRRLELTEIDDWQGDLWYVDGEVYGAPPPPRASAQHRAQPEWARARDLMPRVFPNVHVDSGHTREIARSWRSVVLVPVDANGMLRHCIVLFPHEVGPDYAMKARREWRILVQLARAESLPFRAPVPYACVLDQDDTVVVESRVHGTNRSKTLWPSDPSELVAGVAAAVHRLDIDVPGAATRREFALAKIDDVERNAAGIPSIAARGAPGLVHDAISLARSSLPRADPTRFVHGSLNNNILRSFDDADLRPALVDFQWVAAGDPAYDIAIVTRGVTRPFGIAGGLERLLDVYANVGGAPIEMSDVRLYEALVLAHNVCEWRKANPTAIPPMEQALASLLKRA